MTPDLATIVATWAAARKTGSQTLTDLALQMADEHCRESRRTPRPVAEPPQEKRS